MKGVSSAIKVCPKVNSDEMLHDPKSAENRNTNKLRRMLGDAVLGQENKALALNKSLLTERLADGIFTINLLLTSS